MPGVYSVSMRKVLIVLAAITFAGCSKPAVVTQTPQPEPQPLLVSNQPAGLKAGDECELFEPQRTYVMCAKSPEHLALALRALKEGDQAGLDALKNDGAAGFLPNFTRVQIDEMQIDCAKVHGVKGSVIGKAFYAPLQFLRKTVDK